MIGKSHCFLGFGRQLVLHLTSLCIKINILLCKCSYTYQILITWERSCHGMYLGLLCFCRYVTRVQIFASNLSLWFSLLFLLPSLIDIKHKILWYSFILWTFISLKQNKFQLGCWRNVQTYKVVRVLLWAPCTCHLASTITNMSHLSFQLYCFK